MPSSKIAGSASGAPSAYTDAGPPERTSAAGFRARISSAAESMGDELGVDARLAHAAGDQLAVLAAEVEHEHRAILGARLGTGEREHLGRLSHGGSSALPS